MILHHFADYAAQRQMRLSISLAAFEVFGEMFND